LSQDPGLLLVAFLYSKNNRGPEPFTRLSLLSNTSSLSIPADEEALVFEDALCLDIYSKNDMMHPSGQIGYCTDAGNV
jgi:hypothetical protein